MTCQTGEMFVHKGPLKKEYRVSTYNSLPNLTLLYRVFHDIGKSWRLASGESSSDVKELIPDMFYLPEILTNDEGFNLGKRQNGASALFGAIAPRHLPPERAAMQRVCPGAKT